MHRVELSAQFATQNCPGAAGAGRGKSWAGLSPYTSAAAMTSTSHEDTPDAPDDVLSALSAGTVCVTEMNPDGGSASNWGLKNRENIASMPEAGRDGCNKLPLALQVAITSDAFVPDECDGGATAKPCDSNRHDSGWSQCTRTSFS